MSHWYSGNQTTFLIEEVLPKNFHTQPYFTPVKNGHCALCKGTDIVQGIYVNDCYVVVHGCRSCQFRWICGAPNVTKLVHPN